MPLRNNNRLLQSPRRSSELKKPPEPMLWSLTGPVLSAAVIFDALRFFFNMFWFFGPAMAAIYCTSTINGAAGTTVSSFGGKIVAGGCTIAAGITGFITAPALESFGVIMAIVIGFLGWMVVGLMFLLSNPRGVSENKFSILWLIASLFVSEIPFVDALPSLTVTLTGLYAAQIKKERADWAVYQQALAEEERVLQAQRALAFLEFQNEREQGQDEDLADEEEIPVTSAEET